MPCIHLCWFGFFMLQVTTATHTHSETYPCKQRPGGWVDFLKSVAPAPFSGLLTLSFSVYRRLFYPLTFLAVAKRPWSQLCTLPGPAQERTSGVRCAVLGQSRDTLPEPREVQWVAELGKASGSLFLERGVEPVPVAPWISRSQGLSKREGRPPTNHETCMGFL